MRKSFLSIMLIFSASFVFAQKDTIITSGNEKVFTKVQVESEFPGGQAAWSKFLSENLTYPNKAVRKNIEGMVIVQFIVDASGKISYIEAISGPELLRKAAEDVIRRSPDWIPAIDGGVKVKSYKKQPIGFRLR